MDFSLQVVDGGFGDPVIEAQSVFRALLDAMSNPATVHGIEGLLRAPAPLSPVAAALAATLLDADTPVWLCRALSAQPAVKAWIAFHTGAPIVANPSEAQFALCANPAMVPSLDVFAQGTQEYPDRSTTIIFQVEHFDGEDVLGFEGPGIEGRASLSATPLPRHFKEQWADNRKRFPRGVDVVFAGPDAIAALPRTARPANREA